MQKLVQGRSFVCQPFALPTNHPDLLLMTPRRNTMEDVQFFFIMEFFSHVNVTMKFNDVRIFIAVGCNKISAPNTLVVSIQQLIQSKANSDTSIFHSRAYTSLSNLAATQIYLRSAGTGSSPKTTKLAPKISAISENLTKVRHVLNVKQLLKIFIKPVTDKIFIKRKM